MGMVGSFIGFTIGGAAATMEVERNMPDAHRFVNLTPRLFYFGSYKYRFSTIFSVHEADKVIERCRCSQRSPKIHVVKL